MVDVEATGLGRFDRRLPFDDDYPVSIGIVVASIDDYEKRIRCIDSYYSLIRIPKPVGVLESTVFHKIYPKDLVDAPVPNEVCRQIMGLYRRHGKMPAGAWNYHVDRYFVEILFKMGGMKKPEFKWIELKPNESASLDKYVAEHVVDQKVRNLRPHHALNDCVRALGVMAAITNSSLDLSGVEWKN